MELTSENVNKVFLDCIYRGDEDHEGSVYVEGIRTGVGFHPKRLEANKSNIQQMLYQLPDQFKRKSKGFIGEGETYRKMGFNKKGDRWCVIPFRVEQLLLLGLAADLIKPLVKRELWHNFPHRLPYVKVL